MKKYLFIAVMASFSFFACTKADIIQPDANTKVSASISTEPRSDAVGECYTVTNLETEWGVVEYVFTYTDCSGSVQRVALPPMTVTHICTNNPEKVETNFYASVNPCR